GAPVDPGRLVVLAVGVVVPPLRAAELVAGGQHRHAGGQQQGGQVVAHLAGAQGVDLRVVGGPLDPAVPVPVVALAVPVVLAVGLVALVLVADQVGEGEPVGRGDAGEA